MNLKIIFTYIYFEFEKQYLQTYILKVLRLRGGMPKRKKIDDEDNDESQLASSGSIPNMTNMLMVSHETDARVIRDIINYKFDTTEWLESLDIKQIETLNEFVVKYKLRENIDTAIRSYSVTHDLMVSVEDYITHIQLHLFKHKNYTF